MKLGALRLEVGGFNQLRLLGELSKSEIKISELDKKSASIMLFTIAKKDSEKTFAIFEKLCYNYKVISRTDAVALLTVAVARAGLIAGLIIFSVLLALSYGFIWRIDISGNEKVDELTIERALKESGIGVGKAIKNVDKNHVQRAVNSIGGILESSVEIHGATLRISVVETTDYEPHPQPNFSAIVSQYDAEVTRMIVTSGTANVKIGSRVAKGAVLVDAFYTNALEEQIPVSAKAKIYGITSFSKTIEFSTVESEYVRTGKSYTKTEYEMYGLKINGKEKHGFETFETETKSIYLFSGLFVPLRMKQTVYYETVKNETIYEPEARAEYFKSLIIDELIIKAGGSEVESSHVLSKTSETTYKLSVYLVVEMLIGEG